MSKKFVIFWGCAAFFLLFLGKAGATGVVDVIDVDRVRLTDGREVHLAGLAPLKQALPCGNEIKFLEGLLRGRDIQVVPIQGVEKGVFIWFEIFPDSEQLRPEEMVLPQFYVTERRPGPEGKMKTFVFLNGTLIKAGYARPDPYFQYPRYTSLFNDLYFYARQNDKGLCGEPPI